MGQSSHWHGSAVGRTKRNRRLCEGVQAGRRPERVAGDEERVMKFAIPLVLAVLALAGCGSAGGGAAAQSTTTVTTAPTVEPSPPAPTAVPATPTPRAVTVADLDAMAWRIFP